MKTNQTTNLLENVVIIITINDNININYHNNNNNQNNKNDSAKNIDNKYKANNNKNISILQIIIIKRAQIITIKIIIIKNYQKQLKGLKQQQK